MPRLPGWAQSEAVWAASTIASAVLFVVGVAAVPIVFAKLPEDFLIREPVPRAPSIQLLRMTAGVLLIALGITLLVLPGPGVLVILLGVSFIDFPGKRDIVRRLLARPHVLAGINRIRQRRGEPPLRAH